MIIGFSGLISSGKDTAADVLVKEHGFIRVGFADKLKRFCQDLFQFSDAQTWGALKEVPDPRYAREDGTTLTPRHAFAQLGTEWGRACYPNVWIDDALRTAKQLQKDPTHDLYYNAKVGIWRGVERRVNGVVFTDARFVNEMNAIRSVGGLVIRLARGMRDIDAAAAHLSEAEQLTVPDSFFDAVIQNDGMSREEFEHEVRKVYRELC